MYQSFNFYSSVENKITNITEQITIIKVKNNYLSKLDCFAMPLLLAVYAKKIQISIKMHGY